MSALSNLLSQGEQLYVITLCIAVGIVLRLHTKFKILSLNKKFIFWKILLGVFCLLFLFFFFTTNHVGKDVVALHVEDGKIVIQTDQNGYYGWHFGFYQAKYVKRNHEMCHEKDGSLCQMMKFRYSDFQDVKIYDGLDPKNPNYLLGLSVSGVNNFLDIYSMTKNKGNRFLYIEPVSAIYKK